MTVLAKRKEQGVLNNRHGQFLAVYCSQGNKEHLCVCDFLRAPFSGWYEGTPKAPQIGVLYPNRKLTQH